MANCSVPGCLDEVSNKKRSLCSKCAASNYYWDRKPRAQIAERKKKLSFWQKRMKHFT